MDIHLYHRVLEGIRMNSPHHTDAHKGGHGTTASYVVGFLLSLVFTAVPYYMVVSKTLTGTALLAAILGFAVVQMLIQIFFFLHLGRGPKPLYNVVFFVFTVGTILVVVGGSIFIMNNLQYNMTPAEVVKKLAQDEAIYQIGGEKTGACQGTHENHQVTIRDGRVTPVHVEAQLCDTLTFLNQDEEVREIAFGLHPQHSGYSGEDELLVRKGRGKTITLNQVGTYRFHDHLEPDIAGSFRVLP
jgi:cytochrome o ubiquinol oxidase subunit IV